MFWKNITKIYKRQRDKGIRTYGQPLEDFKTPDAIARIEYIEEELVDALMYLEWFKERISHD